jgi:hypothetical protein
MFRLSVGEEERPPGHLIVGKVTDNSAIIWTKGSDRYATAVLTLAATCPNAEGEDPSPETVDLVRHRDNTAVATFEGLRQNTSYEVTALFRSPYGFDDTPDARRMVRASFRTAPGSDKDCYPSFCFLLGSCNLSIVSINNLAARGLEIIGVYAARQSLRRPAEDDKPLEHQSDSFPRKFGRWWMLSRFRRWVIDWLLKLGIGAIFAGTGGKWPRQPLLRSPFLKLEALFAGRAVYFHRLSTNHRPMPGDEIRGSQSNARGVVAFAPRYAKGGWSPLADEEASEASADKTDRGDEKAASGQGEAKGEWCTGRFILVDVKGDFQIGDRLIHVTRERKAPEPPDKETIGYIVDIAKVCSVYEKPLFTLHAGDQIYFDFPNAKRPPDVARYHEAYREAWFADRHQRSFLARGAHYMTLDDHEIVDQYSIDRDTPIEDDVPEGYTPDEYSREQYEKASMAAYRHYVRRRHPGRAGEENVNYVDFDHGQARFFLLDTRTERRRRPDTTLEDPEPDTRMIGKAQMAAFKRWLTADIGEEGPERLKFVVSSVPFIAEILSERGRDDADRRIERSDDKWSGAPFLRQRQEIIELIAEKRIQNLVFLVGDMHCSYHASMTIGAGRRWERLRLHELAGGPINQLQHGRKRQFATAVRQMTRRRKIPYDIRMHQFHSGANAVMHVKVGRVCVDSSAHKIPEIHWQVIRTLTEFDGGPWFDGEHDDPGRVDDEAPISGRIILRPAMPPQEEGAA